MTLTNKEIVELINNSYNKDSLISTAWESWLLYENEYGHYYVKWSKKLKVFFKFDIEDIQQIIIFDNKEENNKNTEDKKKMEKFMKFFNITNYNPEESIEVELIINPEGEDRILFEFENFSDWYSYYSANFDFSFANDPEKRIFSFFGDWSYAIEVDEESGSSEVIGEYLDKYAVHD